MVIKGIIRGLTSLRLTVVCLALAIMLVFMGTLAQVQIGLYRVQHEFFRSFFVFQNLPGTDTRIPIFPGGYLIGGLLLINLIAAHIARFQCSWRKSGILLTHAGLVLLLLGQFGTDLMSTESEMRLAVDETSNYSENFRFHELIVTSDTSGSTSEIAVVPESQLLKRGEIDNLNLPAKLIVKDYWQSCSLLEKAPPQAQPSTATRGVFAYSRVLPIPTNQGGTRARAVAVIDLVTDHDVLGTWLLAAHMAVPEHFNIAGRQWNMFLESVPEMGGNVLFLTIPGRPPGEQPAPIGERELVAGHELASVKAPFRIRIRQFWPNCRIYPQPEAAAVAPEVTQGPYIGWVVEPQKPQTTADYRNISAALVEVITPTGSLGTWILSTAYRGRQAFALGGRTYGLELRFARHYQPFSITLLKATHQKYAGTEIPKDYRSRVRVRRADTGEVRESEIYMNAPLRFAGFTFYQYQMSADESTLRAGEPPSSTFQVVKNPVWLTPYISCALVATGLLVQFLMHLVEFIFKRKAA